MYILVTGYLHPGNSVIAAPFAMVMKHIVIVSHMLCTCCLDCRLTKDIAKIVRGCNSEGVYSTWCLKRMCSPNKICAQDLAEDLDISKACWWFG